MSYDDDDDEWQWWNCDGDKDLALSLLVSSDQVHAYRFQQKIRHSGFNKSVKLKICHE
jgi:hypothetical protein